MPYNYFRYSDRGVEFYPNGNGNGMPVYYFSFGPFRTASTQGRDAVGFYPNGNANGMPVYFFRKSGRMVEFFPNGNANGMPTRAINGVNDIREVIELVFYLFIPQGREHRPN